MVDSFLHKYSAGGEAHLPLVDEGGAEDGRETLVQVSIIENDASILASQLWWRRGWRRERRWMRRKKREGGREGKKEGGKEGMRKGVRKGGKVEGVEGGREGERGKERGRGGNGTDEQVKKGR